ncbi:hypothetical protein [Burkholderia cepacia]|uniref:hypothetical protein n=1 Tax=Burkholderia cepacia TaxID=292 RepID=UPI000754AB30|nr:hypothetical protein [Burkholderia cepacia]KVW79984.1 hypothetical protein WL00_32125 [Burkholderia cepacia]KVX77269.1 hypothetical protein WL07_02350 [Burkholderia cepacia]
MTVNSSTQSVTYNGDGSTTAFPIPFYFLRNEDIHAASVLNEVGTDLVFGTDYSLSGAGDPNGGTLTMFVAPSVGYQLVIDREVAVTQQTEYQQNDPFPAKTTEKALDKLTMICQQIVGVLGSLTPGSARALLLGRYDVNGFGAYQANGNRIANLGYPQSTTDAATLGAARDIAEQITSGAQGALGTFIQDGPGSVPRTFQAKMRNSPVSPEDKGAAGDGVTLDDAAFAQLAAMPAGTVIDGGNRVFLISQPVTFNNRVSLRIKLKAAPTFPNAGWLVKIAGDGSIIDIDVDGNSRSIVGVAVTGNDCYGAVRGKNIVGTDASVGGGMQSVLYLVGNNNRVSAYGENLLHNGAPNPSVPRVMSVAASSGNIVPELVGNNAHCLAVTQAAQISITYGEAINCGDNGLYDIAAGSDVHVGTLVFRGDNGSKVQTVVAEGRVTIDNLVVRDVYGYAAVDYNGSLIIGNYSIITSTPGKTHQPVVSRGNTGSASVRIASLSGNIWLADAANGGGVLQFFAGTINQLEVGRIALDLYYQAGSTKQLLVQTNGSGAMCAFDEIRLRLFDTTGTLTSSDVFSWQFPTYSLQSYVNSVQLDSTPAVISMSNLLQANLRPPTAAEVAAGNGAILSNVIGSTPRIFYGTGVPTGGTYRTGDVIKSKFPSLGKPSEYTCVGGGTPGTWTRSAGTVKRDVTANRPTGLTFADIGTIFFDNTLNGNGKPIFWSGTAWVDSNGNAA